MAVNQQDITQGVNNLLLNCAQLKPHETLLIICEDPALGWYDAAAPNAVAAAAVKMGIYPTQLSVGKPECDIDPEVGKAIANHDCTIYFSRIGDQNRFSKQASGKRSVMCYVRDIDTLASIYCRASYGAFVALKNAVNEALLSAKHIEVTCPLGTNFSGEPSKETREQKADVSIARFPLGVPLPLQATKFSGRIAITHYLTPTGSNPYTPASITLPKVSFAEIENGRIVKFTGNAAQNEKIKQHYSLVASQFGIDRDIVHSWHAGIHPASFCNANASANADLWSNTIFTSPRFVHFHTCGDYAPAEIAWMVLDPTIRLDGKALWSRGRLDPEVLSLTKRSLEQWPELHALFSKPSQKIGL